MKKDLAVVTDGCRLPFKHIIHVASPHVRQEKNENYELLKQCYWNILTKASGQRDISSPGSSVSRNRRKGILPA